MTIKPYHIDSHSVSVHYEGMDLPDHLAMIPFPEAWNVQDPMFLFDVVVQELVVRIRGWLDKIKRKKKD
jgi:hypothetical protein